MSAQAGTAPALPDVAVRPDERHIRPGWITIAGKELADHLLSVRLYVLLVILGIAAVIPLYFVGEDVRSAATSASGYPAIFIYLFAYPPQGVNFGPLSFTVSSFVAIAAPLLGVAFGFDAVNGERHQGTLPRLLSQPIHRDDVINGKFAGALLAITLALAVVLAVITGFGMLRLGIVPRLDEIIRLVAWLAVTVLYVALWLAFGMLLSVVIRRAATSALVGFGLWLFIAMPFIGPLLVSLLGTFVATGATTQAEYASTVQWVARLLPGQVYAEASAALLRPTLTSVSASEIYSTQAQQQIPTLFSFDQSFALIIPHVVILFALTVGCFALAYARFMRQEVRA